MAPNACLFTVILLHHVQRSMNVIYLLAEAESNGFRVLTRFSRYLSTCLHIPNPPSRVLNSPRGSREQACLIFGYEGTSCHFVRRPPGSIVFKASHSAAHRGRRHLPCRGHKPVSPPFSRFVLRPFEERSAYSVEYTTKFSKKSGIFGPFFVVAAGNAGFGLEKAFLGAKKSACRVSAGLRFLVISTCGSADQTSCHTIDFALLASPTAVRLPGPLQAPRQPPLPATQLHTVACPLPPHHSHQGICRDTRVWGNECRDW